MKDGLAPVVGPADVRAGRVPPVDDLAARVDVLVAAERGRPPRRAPPRVSVCDKLRLPPATSWPADPGVACVLSWHRSCGVRGRPGNIRAVFGDNPTRAFQRRGVLGFRALSGFSKSPAASVSGDARLGAVSRASTLSCYSAYVTEPERDTCARPCFRLRKQKGPPRREQGSSMVLSILTMAGMRVISARGVPPKVSPNGPNPPVV